MNIKTKEVSLMRKKKVAKEYVTINTSDLDTKRERDLTRMSVNELKAEKAKIDLLLSGKTKELKESPTLVTLFYTALSAQFMNILSQELPPLGVIKTNKKMKHVYNKLNETQSFLDKFLRRVLGRRPTRPERSKIYFLYVELTINSLSRSPIPVNLRTVLNSHESFPSIFDKSFPGYINNPVLVLAVIQADMQNLEELED
jgi:hypothetical protein